MKTLIPINEHGLFADRSDTARADSRFVAKAFDKQHKNVLQDIERLDCSEAFFAAEFSATTYTDVRGKRQPCCTMTRNGEDRCIFLTSFLLSSTSAIKRSKCMTYDDRPNGSNGAPSATRRTIRSILDDPLTQIPPGHILHYARLDHEDPLENLVIVAFVVPVKGYSELMECDAWNEASGIIEKFSGRNHDGSSSFS